MQSPHTMRLAMVKFHLPVAPRLSMCPSGGAMAQEQKWKDRKHDEPHFLPWHGCGALKNVSKSH